MSRSIPRFVAKYSRECASIDEVGENSNEHHAALYIEYRLIHLGLFTSFVSSIIGLTFVLLHPPARYTCHLLTPPLATHCPFAPRYKPSASLPSTWYTTST